MVARQSRTNLQPMMRCGYCCRTIDCAVDLFNRGLSVEDIEEILIELPDFHYAIADNDAPTSVSEARFSVTFGVAAARAPSVTEWGSRY